MPGIDIHALRDVAREGKVRGARAEFRTMRLIAHGLAFDPHIDGRLKLTPPGKEKLDAVAAPAVQEGLF